MGEEATINELERLSEELDKEIKKYKREQYAEWLWKRWTKPISTRYK